MLSNNNPPAPVTAEGAAKFETIITAIKAPLANLYGHDLKFNLDAELSDEQFQQIETVLEETLAEWHARINFTDFTKISLQEIKQELDEEIAGLQLEDIDIEDIDEKPTAFESSHSENLEEESDQEAEEKELTLAEVEMAFKRCRELKKNQRHDDSEDDSEDEKISLATKIEQRFNTLQPSWAVNINFPYNNDGFIKFITTLIKKKSCHCLLLGTVVSENVVEQLLRACNGLPEDSLFLSFHKGQYFTDQQARKALAALPSFRCIEFSEQNEISVETASELVNSKYAGKLMVNGYGNYHQAAHRKHILDAADFARIFHYAIDCSMYDIERLLIKLKEQNYPARFEVWKGNYTTPAWEHFFSTALTDPTYKIITLDIGYLTEQPFAISDAVLLAIFTALKINKTIWKLELRNINLTLDCMGMLIAAFAENDHVQELILNHVSLPRLLLGNLLDALNSNPHSKVSTLNLNNTNIIDTPQLGEKFETLLSVNKTIRALLLGRTYIGKNIWNGLANGLKKNKTLVQLSVFENNFDDKALLDLADGLLENNTLGELNIAESPTFSAEAMANFLEFKKHHYSAEFSFIAPSKNYLTVYRVITTRDEKIKLNKHLKLMTTYVWMAVILYRAEKNHKFTRAPIAKVIIDLILPYFFPKDAEPLQHKELIKANTLTGIWRTSVTVDNPRDMFNPMPTTREKVLFERWVPKNHKLKIDGAITYLRRPAPTDIDFISGEYIDLEKASRLGAALQTNTWLTRLNLSMCQLDDDDFELIALGLLNRDKPLTVLNLDQNNLTTRSAARLRQLLVNGKVKNIMIFMNAGLKNDTDCVAELKIIAAEANAKIHFDAPLKRQANTGFFVPNPARMVIEVMDEKEEKAVNALRR